MADRLWVGYGFWDDSEYDSGFIVGLLSPDRQAVMGNLHDYVIENASHYLDFSDAEDVEDDAIISDEDVRALDLDELNRRLRGTLELRLEEWAIDEHYRIVPASYLAALEAVVDYVGNHLDTPDEWRPKPVQFHGELLALLNAVAAAEPKEV